jgi:hypothetical protein
LIASRGSTPSSRNRFTLPAIAARGRCNPGDLRRRCRRPQGDQFADFGFGPEHGGPRSGRPSARAMLAVRGAILAAPLQLVYMINMLMVNRAWTDRPGAVQGRPGVSEAFRHGCKSRSGKFPPHRPSNLAPERKSLTRSNKTRMGCSGSNNLSAEDPPICGRQAYTAPGSPHRGP